MLTCNLFLYFLLVLLDVKKFNALDMCITCTEDGLVFPDKVVS